MVLVVMGVVIATDKLLDHCQVAGQDQADRHAAGDQVGINDAHANQFHGCFLLEQRSH
ncbi:hypothetical protein D3C81_1795150 [compost metagenome]